ncbi:MAG: ECF transporter S component [Herpetosiphonaceae bacterium]|nr:ECF transporter S component [Herpetosiphonaceae bacterium]
MPSGSTAYAGSRLQTEESVGQVRSEAQPLAAPARLLQHSGTLLLVVVSLIGLAAFGYPFLLSRVPQHDPLGAHAADAPLIVGLLVPLLLLLVLAELGTRQASAKLIALLGVLTAMNAVLRLPTGLGDSPTVFFLPILLGYAYGAQFGFLVGALSIFVSAFLIPAGFGPWLPFQMFALGWLGMGAAALRPVQRLGHWPERIILTLYGYVGCLLFGVLINLYFWPLTASGSALDWQPGLGLVETVARYRLFYLATSLAWDTLRGLFTAGLILVLGAPILLTLRRFGARWSWQPIVAIDNGAQPS